MSNTQRTDSIISAIDMDQAFQDLCRQLERELVDKTNEVARLREELQEYKDTQITFTLALLENKDLQIARLREQRNRAIEIADEIEQSVDNMFYAGARVKLPVFKKLSKLKAEIEEAA